MTERGERKDTPRKLAMDAYVQNLAKNVVVDKLNKDREDWAMEEIEARREGRIQEADQIVQDILKDFDQFDEIEDTFDEEEHIIGNLVKKNKKNE